MSIQIEREDDPKNPLRSGYRLTGPSFEAVQMAIENLSPPFAPGIAEATFTLPCQDRANGWWVALGQVIRADKAVTA